MAIVLLAFVPTGFEFLNYSLIDLGLVEEQKVELDPSTLITRLPNENKFTRDYELLIGSDYGFYELAGRESKMREIHDKYGIQLYFVDYAMDLANLHESRSDTLKELKALIEEKIGDPYGIYYATARYEIDYDFYEDNEDIEYWNSEVHGEIIFGEAVDAWWDTEIQKAFEASAKKNDYYLGGYNSHEDFIDTLAEMKIANYNVPEELEEEREPNPFGNFCVFILFSVLPVGVVIAVIVKDRQKRNDEKRHMEAEELQEILSTPIKTLEEEYAEELKDKYTHKGGKKK